MTKVQVHYQDRLSTQIVQKLCLQALLPGDSDAFVLWMRDCEEKFQKIDAQLGDSRFQDHATSFNLTAQCLTVTGDHSSSKNTMHCDICI